MALESLRDEISRLAINKKTSQEAIITRTYYVLLSPSMSILEKHFKKCFPICNDEINLIQPWLVLDDRHEGGDDKLENSIKDILVKSLDINIVSSLTKKGFQFSSTTSQIIFIGDLTEKDLLNNINSIPKIFQTLINDLIPNTNLFFTGIFLIRNIRNEEKLSFSTINVSDLNTTVKSLKENFNKVFFIDISNPNNNLITNNVDIYSLISQLLYFLNKIPIDFIKNNKPTEFAEWMQRNSISQDKVNAFAGISFAVPIEQVLENILIIKAGEILEEAFISSHTDEIVDYYFNSIINKSFLNSKEVYKRTLIEQKTYPLLNPLDELQVNKTKWDINYANDFFKLISKIDAYLSEAVNENKKIMQKFNDKLLHNFRYTLREHLNHAIVNEKGGLIVAEKVLNKLKEHIEKMIEERPINFSYSNLDEGVEALKKICETLPTIHSLFARISLLSFTAFLGTYASRSIFDSIFIVFSLLACAPLGWGLVSWYASKNKVENLVSNIWKNLLEKWRVIMDKEAEHIYSSCIVKYVTAIDELNVMIKDTSKRMQEIADYFKNKYIAEVEDTSAFWINILETKEQIMKYKDIVKTDFLNNANEYIREEKPMELWLRASKPGSPNINEWEWRLVENIGIRLLKKGCVDITGLSICKVIRDTGQSIDKYSEVLNIAGKPFINLKPAVSPQVTAKIEFPQEGCESLLNDLTNIINPKFTNIEKNISLSPYRIYLFTFAEGVELKDIKIGESK